MVIHAKKGDLGEVKKEKWEKAGLRIILVADGLPARQGHNPYVLKYFEKVTVTLRDQ